MKKRTSFAARILAALALVAAVLTVVLIVSAAGKESSSGKGNRSATTSSKNRPSGPRQDVHRQAGDTLIAIAHKTGVPVPKSRP